MLKNLLASFKKSLQKNIINPEPGPYYLSLCCIIKDENDYLEEWMRYHLKVGVEHFYIYDNGSKIPVKKTLDDIKLSEYATVTVMRGKARQVKAYNTCLKKFGHTSQWIGFIDTDEFMVAKTTNGDVKAFLKQYEDYGGLGVNDIVFGSSGHVKRTNLPQLESFLMRSEENFGPNKHIKSIVQPAFTEASKGAHKFAYKEGKFCVNENLIPVADSFSPVSINKIQLNHYYCRSLEEYEAKIARGYGDTSKKRTAAEFYHHDDEANKVKDTTILNIRQLEGYQH